MNQPMNRLNSFQMNGSDIGADEFIRAACEPGNSVVVEACAGSGKTWLLVARMLRLLLAGAEPGELLAITFTRKAAQEMQHRLMALLQELALAPDDVVAKLLLERGVDRRQLHALQPIARGLYERVLSAPQALNLDTFHSWFRRLIQIAPLNSGIPHGYTLTESTSELQREAYRQLMQALNTEQHRQTKDALLFLYEELGDWTTQKMLDAFLDKRTEWWACNQTAEQGTPLAWLMALCDPYIENDARLALWEEHDWLQRITEIARWLGQGTAINQKRAMAIESALSAGASAENFDALCDQFFDAKGISRKNTKTKALLAALEQDLGARCEIAFDEECSEIAAHLQLCRARSQEKMVIRMNQALFHVGSVYLDLYQAVKADQRVVDFSDLEWLAYRLLQSDQHAAYMQSRLDARYQHILLDEFQDTNPLQWGILRAWLDAYGDDVRRPSVFIVGDPKQSIYRFRRADPRVFTAASTLLQEQGAVSLRTNQTRRNAAAVIDVLNDCMIPNPLFTPQSTLSKVVGGVWRLPLIVNKREEENKKVTSRIRNPLTTPAEESEDALRLQEGRQLAQALLALRENAAAGAEPISWSEVMLLVRRRTHLTAYETALREVGIPFISGRRGGLLNALEISDLIALLRFLMTPGDNQALAHVLKSPIFSVSDDDLIDLAQQSGSTWWQRLQATCTAQFDRARTLLPDWMEAAHYLPVHDLLDRIFDQGELVKRYAQHAACASRNQVIGNLSAFIELALNLDAGRYPGLPKFIAALNTFQASDEDDTPDESLVESTADALRILTIHSAKGLEARLVVLVDANHSESAADSGGILIEWPLGDKNEEKHFSAYGRRDQRGAVRNKLFQQEEALMDQENWNLLYVAMTRAKQWLIVSGVAKSGAAITEQSWYGRLQHVAEIAPVTDFHHGEMENAEAIFKLTDFVPPKLLAFAMPVAPVATSTEAQQEGVALHALMERLTMSHQSWPIAIPDAASIARWLSCSLALAETIRDQAGAILGNPALTRFFDPAQYQFARNEMSMMIDNKLLRPDRVVVFEHAVWVLDFKRQILDSEITGYQTQLRQYCDALQNIFSGYPICAGFILADGSLAELAPSVSKDTRCIAPRVSCYHFSPEKDQLHSKVNRLTLPSTHSNEL